MKQRAAPASYSWDFTRARFALLGLHARPLRIVGVTGRRARRVGVRARIGHGRLNTNSCVVVVARAGETDPNECARSLGGVQPADEARGRTLGRMII